MRILLVLLSEREMFCAHFRCSIMINENTFHGNIHVRKLKGSEYINLYVM